MMVAKAFCCHPGRNIRPAWRIRVKIALAAVAWTVCVPVRKHPGTINLVAKVALIVMHVVGIHSCPAETTSHRSSRLVKAMESCDYRLLETEVLAFEYHHSHEHLVNDGIVAVMAVCWAGRLFCALVVEVVEAKGQSRPHMEPAMELLNDGIQTRALEKEPDIPDADTDLETIVAMLVIVAGTRSHQKSCLEVGSEGGRVLEMARGILVAVKQLGRWVQLEVVHILALG